MRAIVITKFGGPEVLSLVDRPTPEPSRGEVRVRIRATAINRADLLQRMGFYPAPADSSPDIPGLEFAGEIDAVGPDVQRWKTGDRVFGLAGGGTYAEAVVAHERALAAIPEGLSFEHAAAIPEAFITAHDAIVTQANLTVGQTLLVHAIGSGVGTAAAQLGRALGVQVIGTARNEDKLARAKALGMTDGVLVKDGKFADAVKAIAAPHVVLELVGGTYVNEDLRCVQKRGTIMVVGLMAGAKTELDLARMLERRARVIGTVLRARPLEEKIAAMRAFEEQVVPLLARGLIQPVIDGVMPLAEAAAAHARMASNDSFGKLVLVA